jgi:NAD kinase
MLKFKDGVTGFLFNANKGSLESVYTEELNEAEVTAFNKRSSNKIIFNNIDEVGYSLGVLIDGKYHLNEFHLDDYNLKSAIEIID